MLQDHRSIPVEVLRDFARTQCEMTSIRAAADEAGIGHSTLHKFILGRTTPKPRVRRLLGLWYLRKKAELPHVDLVRPYVSALSILLGNLPEESRVDAQAEAIAALCSIHDSLYVQRPRWLDVLAERWTAPHWLERL